MDSELLLKAASLFLEAASRRRKAEQETLKDEDFCLNPGDPHVVGKHRHYPIYDEHSAKRSIAQVKGLASIPAWWAACRGCAAVANAAGQPVARGPP